VIQQQPPLRGRGPGRPPGAVAGHGRVTHERIIQTAIELFAARGFHATSVADIGQRVGLKPGALYYHIGSKEDLLWLILRDYTTAALTGAEQIVASPVDPAAMRCWACSTWSPPGTALSAATAPSQQPNRSAR